MQPTLHFRWAEIIGDKAEENAVASSVNYYPECGPKHFVLQQWWTDPSQIHPAGGEWRNVSSTFFGDATPPTP